jgi:hypothetical protein
MWLDRIIEEKEKLGISPKTMSERTGGRLPEKTIIRILTRKTETPRIDTIIDLGASVGLTPNEIFADTCAVVAPVSLVDIKEAADVIEAEYEIIKAENEILKSKLSAYELEIELLKRELQHKEELLAVHNYYIKRGLSEQ